MLSLFELKVLLEDGRSEQPIIIYHENCLNYRCIVCDIEANWLIIQCNGIKFGFSEKEIDIEIENDLTISISKK